MGVDEGQVETLVLPLSGWVFQWRHDGWWREVDPDQYRDELAGVFTSSGDEWVRWTGTVHRLARGGWALHPRWQMVYDELPEGCTPRVVLDDGTVPPIIVVGQVWVCEWVSVPQPATVTVGAEQWVMPFGRRPEYLGPDYEG
ncbi:MAG: hypothetical protein QOJ11_445 [Frankiales bacterium]|jgi:hypothetical protein|nr:hypothetical protein [Frankiales bacterium]